MMMTTVTDIYQVTPTSFYLSLLFWTITWITTKLKSQKDTTKPSKNNHFAENGTLLTFTHIIGIILCSLSLFFNNDEIFSESILISWYSSFFIIDLLDCLYRKDVIFTFHAIITLSLCYLNTWPKYYGLRTASMGAYTELSSIFFWRWKKTKTKKDFQRFAIVFFFCRLIWVPTYMIRCSRLVNFDTMVIVATVLFYLLQVVFFYKIVKLLVNYKEEGDNDTNRKKET